MLWLCLQFPALPLEIFSRNTQALASNEDTPRHAVIENQYIVCMNKAAKTQGIQQGMSAATAAALDNNIQLIARNRDKEQQALMELANTIYNISPAVNIYEKDSVMIEISAVLKLHGGLQQVIHRLSRSAKSCGYTPQFGLAPTPKAAYLFAQYFSNQTPCFDDNRQGFSNSDFKQLLGQLPLSLLGNDKRQQHFQQLGLRKVADLMSLPIAAIGKRFGSDFLVWLGQLHGDIKDPQTPIEAPHRFSQSAFFEPAVAHTQGLGFPMRRLLGTLGNYLRQHQWQCNHIEWHLIGRDKQLQRITVHADNAVFSAAQFLELSQLHLEKVQLTQDIEQLTLFCDSFNVLMANTTPLFDKEANTQNTNLVNKLQAKLGADNVYQLHCKKDHIPELANRRKRISHGTLAQESEQLVLPLDSKRPAWLLPKPEPIQQTDKGLFWRGKLSIIEGPERIESPWHQHMVTRDYFTAKNEQGETYWIYHNRHTNEWFTHGIFS